MIRETIPEDFSRIEEWLSNLDNRRAHTGTDLQWSDFDDVEHAEMSPTLVKHVRSHTLVAENAVVGIVVTYPTFDYPWVWHLEVFVDPLMRSSGYGLELLNFAIDDLFKNTFCTVLEGTIAEDNEGSIAAFRKFGDVIVGRIENYFMRRDSTKVAAIRVAMTKEEWYARI